MPKFEQIDPKYALGDTKEAFDEALSQFGGVINLFKVMGCAPNILKGILAFNKEINRSTELDSKLIEQVAMLTSALNRCDYCVSVHIKVGEGAGLSRTDMLLAMEGKANDNRAQVLLSFANEVIRNRGPVDSETFQLARDSGFSDKALLETISVIGFYTTLQYIRHIADPEHDFPPVTEFSVEKHGAEIALY